MKATYKGTITKLYECLDDHAIITITTTRLDFLMKYLLEHSGEGMRYTIEMMRGEGEFNGWTIIFDTDHGDTL